MAYVFSATMIFLPSVFEEGIQLACSWEVFLLNLHLSVSEYLENANRMAENQRNELKDEPLFFQCFYRLFRFLFRSRDFARFEGLLSTIKAQRPEFRIYTGSEELLLVSLVMGADGATVATGGIEPDRIMEIVRAWRAGNLNRARQVQSELLPLIRSWFAEDFPEGFRDFLAAV